MTYWHECTIGGIEFEFTEARILLKPETDITDPLFISAYRTAQVLCPIIHAMMIVDEYHGMNGNWRWFEDDTLETIVRSIDTIEQQELIGIPERCLSFAHDARVEYERRVAKKNRALKKAEGKPGYVYLLKSSMGYYKIGRTKSPNNRLKTFNVKLPFDVEFEHIIQTADMCSLELSLHTRYSQQRVNGEWFALSPDDVAYIKSLGGES